MCRERVYSHTVEVIINIRECDISWWNEKFEKREKELFKLIQCHILPSEFHEEIYNHHNKRRQDQGIIKKPVIGEKNIKKRKANTKNDDTKIKSKKKPHSRSHEASTKVDDGTASKRKYEQDVSYVFGETLQITYKMEEISVSMSATIMYHPTHRSKQTKKENEEDDDSSNNYSSDIISEPKRLCDFFHRPKLSKRILLWCYPFDPSKPSEPNPPGGGFPRPEMIPLSSLFYEPKS